MNEDDVKPAADELQPDPGKLADYGANSAEVRNRALVRAAEQGDLQELVTLLAAGADPDQPVGPWGSALGWATRFNHEPVIQRLLEHGARTDIADARGDYPLHHAAHQGGMEILKSLLDHGAAINASSPKSGTALGTVIKGRQEEAAQLLIERGARADIPGGKHRKFPLQHAARHGMKKIVTLLLAHGAPVHAQDESGSTAVHEAVDAGHTEVLEILCRHHARLDLLRGGKTLLRDAIDAEADAPMLMRLLAHGASYEVDTLGEMLDFSAINQVFTSPTPDGNFTPKRLVAALAKRSDQPQPGAATLQSQSVVDICNLLVKGRYDASNLEILVTDYLVKLPLFREPILHALALADERRYFLIQEGANDEDSSEPDADTALCATLKAHDLWERYQMAERNILTLLHRNPTYTPLTAAAAHDNAQLLGLLLDLGANINLPDIDGRTALHVAAEAGNAVMLQQLLLRGARDAVDAEGNLAAELARRAGIAFGAVADR